VIFWRRSSFLLGNLLLDPLMRPGSVEVVYISAQYPLELLLMQDEQVIETLASHTSKKAFTDGIRLRDVIGYFEHLDSTRLRNPFEAQPKLTVMITDEILRPFTIGGGFPKLLRGPGIGRISCDADVDHSARLQFDDEEGEK
jgi:hypothetical protein